MKAACSKANRSTLDWISGDNPFHIDATTGFVTASVIQHLRRSQAKEFFDYESLSAAARSRKCLPENLRDFCARTAGEMYCNIERHALVAHGLTFLDEAPLDFFLSKDMNSSPTENLFERDTWIAARIRIARATPRLICRLSPSAGYAIRQIVVFTI
jgi:hypothetical protein